jgi:excisionase family DNA binding protein
MTLNTPQIPLLDRPNPSPSDRHLIDVPALAKRLGVTQRFIRRLTAEDRVPFLKIGKFIRFDPQEIDRWIDEARCPAISSKHSMNPRRRSS